VKLPVTWVPILHAILADNYHTKDLQLMQPLITRHSATYLPTQERTSSSHSSFHAYIVHSVVVLPQQLQPLLDLRPMPLPATIDFIPIIFPRLRRQLRRIPFPELGTFIPLFERRSYTHINSWYESAPHCGRESSRRRHTLPATRGWRLCATTVIHRISNPGMPCVLTF
jgi:hypothetical protein